MNKPAILNTAVCFFSEEDDCFVVESPLLEISAGVGDTREDAHVNFVSHVDTAYESYLEGRMKHIYDKPGRPSKGRVTFSADIKQKTRKQLKGVAAQLGCTQGELLDFLVLFYQKRSVDMRIDQTDTNVFQALKDMSDDIQRVVQKRLDKSKIKGRKRAG